MLAINTYLQVSCTHITSQKCMPAPFSGLYPDGVYGKCDDAGGISYLTATLTLEPTAARSVFLVLRSLTDRDVVSSEQADRNTRELQGLHYCSALLHQCSIGSSDANQEHQKPQEGTQANWHLHVCLAIVVCRHVLVSHCSTPVHSLCIWARICACMPLRPCCCSCYFSA